MCDSVEILPLVVALTLGKLKLLTVFLTCWKKVNASHSRNESFIPYIKLLNDFL